MFDSVQKMPLMPVYVALCLFPTLGKVLQWLFYTVFFSFGRLKKLVADPVRQVVVLYSNDCMGICKGGFSIGRPRRVVALQMWLLEQV